VISLARLSLLAGGLVTALPLAGVRAQQGCASLAIEVFGTSREYCYTNKATAFLYGECLGPNRTGWHGFHVADEKVLHDFEIIIAGVPLDRTRSRAVVRPDMLLRIYPNGIRERIIPFDSVAAFAVELLLPRVLPLEVAPVFGDGSTVGRLRVEIRDSVALMGSEPSTADRIGSRASLAMYAPGLEARLSARGGHHARQAPVIAHSPGTASALVVFAAGMTPDSALNLARRCGRHAAELARSRTSRMDALVDESSVVTGDGKFDRALSWAKLSLDALMMNQGGPGIFAGLPWFNNYWGRDTFIALPGAALVTGRFAEARAILHSFALHQELDTSSSDFGRIPNYVGPAGRAYNTADGTPRFVMMLREYVERSGDLEFGNQMYPVVRRSIEGTIRHHVDSLGFLVHGDAETWMDAVGPEGPWSPRGTRANDVQALWDGQLRAGSFLAGIVGDTARALAWQALRDRLKANFPRYFLLEGRLADHLRADLTPDRRIRPNQIFAAPLLPPRARASVVREIVRELTYPYGVSSLAPGDSGFHPYHVYPPYYPKDAAYHNGTVWTWLAGPVVSELIAHGAHSVAWTLTEDATRQILEFGAVGTQSELLDALPRAGESRPRQSGTVSQAWNLAEYIRNFYDDYLGLRVDLLNRQIMLRPRVPQNLDSIQAGLVLPTGRLRITASTNPGRGITLDASALTGTYTLLLDPASGSKQLWEVEIKGESIYSIFVKEQVLTVSPKTNYRISTKPDWPLEYVTLDGLEFLTPSLPADIPTLRPPPYPLISHRDVKYDSGPAMALQVTATDPAGDDHGVGACSGSYQYPLSPDFQPGSFDLRRFSVSMDERFCRFELALEALSDPGWHPEYGFQLTYVAIAIDSDGRTGSRSVGHNSEYILPPGFAYERLVLVGGGVQIEDDSGKILGAYTPAGEDGESPIGSAQDGVIAFSIPREMLGIPDSSWRYIVLVGGQDDHGGAGLGEFRRVDQEASQWHGGGNPQGRCSNVYDELAFPPGR